MHVIRPGFDFLARGGMFLIFLNPGEDSPIAETMSDLFFECARIQAGKLQKVLVKRTVVVVIPVFLLEGGAAFV